MQIFHETQTKVRIIFIFYFFLFLESLNSYLGFSFCCLFCIDSNNIGDICNNVVDVCDNVMKTFNNTLDYVKTRSVYSSICGLVPGITVQYILDKFERDLDE